jgi:hypothetical protein
MFTAGFHLNPFIDRIGALFDTALCGHISGTVFGPALCAAMAMRASRRVMA